MIHNSFRRIALAQGLLPIHARPAEISGTIRGTALNTHAGGPSGRAQEAAGFQLASIEPLSKPSERQIQV